MHIYMITQKADYAIYLKCFLKYLILHDCFCILARLFKIPFNTLLKSFRLYTALWVSLYNTGLHKHCKMDEQQFYVYLMLF